MATCLHPTCAHQSDYEWYELRVSAAKPSYQSHYETAAGVVASYPNEFLHVKSFKTLPEALAYMQLKCFSGPGQAPLEKVVSLNLTHQAPVCHEYATKCHTNSTCFADIIIWERFPTRDQIGGSLLPPSWRTAQQWHKERQANMSKSLYVSNTPPQWVKDQLATAALYQQSVQRY